MEVSRDVCLVGAVCILGTSNVAMLDNLLRLRFWHGQEGLQDSPALLLSRELEIALWFGRPLQVFFLFFSCGPRHFEWQLYRIINGNVNNPAERTA